MATVLVGIKPTHMNNLMILPSKFTAEQLASFYFEVNGKNDPEIIFTNENFIADNVDDFTFVDDDESDPSDAFGFYFPRRV